MNISKNERSGLSAVLIIIGIFLINYLFLGSLIQLGIILASGINIKDLLASGGDISKFPNAWFTLILAQGITSLIAFIGTGWLYWKIIEKKSWTDLHFKPLPKIQIFGLVIVIQLAFMGFGSWLQEFNQNMTFPPFLKGLEEFIKGMEDQLADLTKLLTTFDSFSKFLLAFIVIAVIAGVGEELIFRGLIQRKIFLGTNNIHIAIWGAAFIFSAIHFQFYGFLPRMMLGALFGYLYYWSGNLWIPIFGHIFNNGLIVTVMYLNHLKLVEIDIESIDKVPVMGVIGSLVATVGLMLFFKNIMEKRNQSIP